MELRREGRRAAKAVDGGGKTQVGGVEEAAVGEDGGLHPGRDQVRCLWSVLSSFGLRQGYYHQ